MSATQYWLQLPDDSGPIPVEVTDRSMADRLAELTAAGEHGRATPVRLTAAPEPDTVGHAAGTIVVTAQIGDDVEGHALSLRFANPAQAIEFQRRLIMAGALAATVAIGAVGVASVAPSTPSTQNPAIAAPGPAISVTIDRPARSGPLEQDPGAVTIAPSTGVPAATDVAPDAAAGPSSTDFRRNAGAAAGAAVQGESSVQPDYSDSKDELLRNL